MHRAGYTLVELLAVVVILGLAAGLGIPPLARMADGNPMERLCRRVQAADHQARQLAIGSGMELDMSGNGFRNRGEAVTHELILESGATLAWYTPDGAPLGRLTIDHRGRSIDLMVDVRLGELRRRFTIAGISGEWHEHLPGSATQQRVAP